MEMWRNAQGTVEAQYCNDSPRSGPRRRLGASQRRCVQPMTARMKMAFTSRQRSGSYARKRYGMSVDRLARARPPSAPNAQVVDRVLDPLD